MTRKFFIIYFLAFSLLTSAFLFYSKNQQFEQENTLKLKEISQIQTRYYTEMIHEFYKEKEKKLLLWYQNKITSNPSLTSEDDFLAIFALEKTNEWQVKSDYQSSSPKHLNEKELNNALQKIKSTQIVKGDKLLLLTSFQQERNFLILFVYPDKILSQDAPLIVGILPDFYLNKLIGFEKTHLSHLAFFNPSENLFLGIEKEDSLLLNEIIKVQDSSGFKMISQNANSRAFSYYKVPRTEFYIGLISSEIQNPSYLTFIFQILGILFIFFSLYFIIEFLLPIKKSLSLSSQQNSHSTHQNPHSFHLDSSSSSSEQNLQSQNPEEIKFQSSPEKDSPKSATQNTLFQMPLSKLETLQKISYSFTLLMRGPIMALIGHAQLAGAKAKEEEVKDHCEHIEFLARGVREVLDDLSYLSQAEKLSQKNTSLSKIVEDLCQQHYFVLSREHIQLEKNIETSLFMNAHEEQLKVALQNIFRNAIEASLESSSPEKKIKIHLSKTEVSHQALLRIEDNGIGMTDEILNHLFEPFFTTKKEEHKGLGLAVALGILKSHQAQIEVLRGSTTVFQIFFENLVSPPLESNERIVPHRSTPPSIETKPSPEVSIPEIFTPEKFPLPLDLPLPKETPLHPETSIDKEAHPALEIPQTEEAFPLETPIPRETPLALETHSPQRISPSSDPTSDSSSDNFSIPSSDASLTLSPLETFLSQSNFSSEPEEWIQTSLELLDDDKTPFNPISASPPQNTDLKERPTNSEPMAKSLTTKTNNEKVGNEEYEEKIEKIENDDKTVNIDLAKLNPQFISQMKEKEKEALTNALVDRFRKLDDYKPKIRKPKTKDQSF